MANPTHISVSLPPASFLTIASALRTAAHTHHTYAASPTCTPASSSHHTRRAELLSRLASDITSILAAADISAEEAFLNPSEDPS